MSSGLASITREAGFVGAMGAIKPKSGRRAPDFVAQWQAMAWPWRECDPWNAQHIMVEEASQAMPRASSASGVASSAMTMSEA
jgi:hypothetical protein